MGLPIEICCCYTREDRYFLEELEKHLMVLQRQGLISVWSDIDISPGTDYENEMNKHLKSAQIILLLVSAGFLASDYCYSNQLLQAIERHQQGEVQVIPIILSYSAWRETSLSKLKALPSDARPIRSWMHRDEALFDVTMGIKKVVEDLAVKPASIKEKNISVSSQSKNNEGRLANPPAAHKFLSRSPMAWCPSCINEFHLGDCRIMSKRTGKELKPAPGREQLHLARKNVESLISPKYLRESASRECPHCGYLLPYNIELAENRCIAIVGDVSSGKSHYIASLIYQIKEVWHKYNSKNINLTTLTPHIEQEYYQYISMVFSHKRYIYATGIASPDNKLSPLIYELRFNEFSQYPGRRVNLLFYDGSGEDYSKQERMIMYARHVMYADAIIFLVDPISISKVLNRLPEPLQNQSAPGISASAVIHSTIQLLERFHSGEEREHISSIPVAIMLSKADLLKYTTRFAPSYRFLSNSICSDHIDLQDMKAVDGEVRSLLEGCNQRAILRASQRFSNVNFFATSATGCAPDVDGSFPFIDPCRCLDPLLWILQQFDIVKDQVTGG